MSALRQVAKPDDKCRRQGRALDVVCEKPTVLDPWSLDAIAEIEAATGRPPLAGLA